MKHLISLSVRDVLGLKKKNFCKSVGGGDWEGFHQHLRHVQWVETDLIADT